jgi:hypothetical protein
MSNVLEKVMAMFRRAATSVEEVAHGEEPVTRPAPGAGEPGGESSTNAQVGGATGEPWTGDDS